MRTGWVKLCLLDGENAPADEAPQKREVVHHKLDLALVGEHDEPENSGLGKWYIM